MEGLASLKESWYGRPKGSLQERQLQDVERKEPEQDHENSADARKPRPILQEFSAGQARGRAKQDKDDAKAQHEQESAYENLSPDARHFGRIAQIVQRGAAQEPEVSGYERQRAGGQKRQQSCDEGRNDESNFHTYVK